MFKTHKHQEIEESCDKKKTTITTVSHLYVAGRSDNANALSFWVHSNNWQFLETLLLNV